MKNTILSFLNILFTAFVLYEVYRVERTQLEVNAKTRIVLTDMNEVLGLAESQFKIIGEELWK